MKLIETHCHGKDCERKNNCYRYVILQEKLKNIGNKLNFKFG